MFKWRHSPIIYPFIRLFRSRGAVLSRTLDEIHIRVLAKAIISTPYWHAAELLDDGRGALVLFEDPAAIADTAIELLDNDAARQAMRERAYVYARHMIWNRQRSLICGRSYELALIACHLPAWRFPSNLPRRMLPADS